MKEAVESLLPLERNLFFFLNGSDSLFLDNIFLTITGKIIWAPIVLFLVFMFFFKTPFKVAIITILAVAILVTLCDQISSSIFKDYFQRLRPVNHPEFKDLVDTAKGYRSGGYSFISGHATNSFGIAIFLSLLYKNRWVTIPIISWAVLNSYSRIYLGVHFTSDILGGIITGTLVAIFVYGMYKYAIIKLVKPNPFINNKSAYSTKNAKTIGIALSSYILLVIIFSPLLSTLPK